MLTVYIAGGVAEGVSRGEGGEQEQEQRRHLDETLPRVKSRGNWEESSL